MRGSHSEAEKRVGFIYIYLVYLVYLVYTKIVDNVFERSDWLLKLRISSAIHCYTSSSSERATPNSRELRAKWLLGLLP